MTTTPVAAKRLPLKGATLVGRQSRTHGVCLKDSLGGRRRSRGMTTTPLALRASPRGATLADRRSRIRGVCSGESLGGRRRSRTHGVCWAEFSFGGCHVCCP